MRSRPGRDGLEGLPLQMAIVAVVMAISSPIIYGGLRAYESSALENKVASEAGAMAELAKLLYIGGPGNAQALEVDLRGGLTSNVDYLLVGDVPGGAYESCIRYRIKGQAEKALLIEEPNTPLCGPGGEPLRLLEGTHRLMLECVSDGGAPRVEVRFAAESAKI
ncbi:MAG: hypothetical protein A2341_17935 [Deltaproteobacteria bacterium RIFOXYB12_FULL_58_9]|nr:MAG: hypothetical protein A2341_17935 [Deltaproteobacteria bacterium RIFOXYB12_FULL_58_9]